MTSQSNEPMSSRPRRAHAHRRGAAVLEMAICLMLLLNLTFGAVEFGDAFFKKNTLQGAAREGARVAIIAGKTVAEAQAAATAVLTAAGITGNCTVYVTLVDGDTNYANDVAITNLSSVATGTAIKVRVTAKWKFLGLRPLGLIDGEKDINGIAVMRKES